MTRLVALITAALACVGAPQSEIVLEQLVSREHPSCDIRNSKLSIGLDGRVYLASSSYVLRLDRDGRNRRGSVIKDATWGIAANKEGIIASANAHFQHSVNLWSPAFKHLGGVDDFLNSDATEYFGPCDVVVGESGAFYAPDQNRNRIVKVSAGAKMAEVYSLKETGEDFVSKLLKLRVWEKGRRIYVLSSRTGKLHVLGFDGKVLWSLDAGIGGDPWGGYRGEWDVDGEGVTYILKNDAESVAMIDRDGKPAGEIRLQLGARKGRITGLRLWGDEILIKQPDLREFFCVYDRRTGAFKSAVSGDVEKLTVRFPSDVWTAGESIPVAIAFDTGPRTIAPRWRVWLRPFNTLRYAELPLKDGKITVPADAAGLYQFKVAPGIDGSLSEYGVECLVEIRRAGAKGSATVVTEGGRTAYGRGEAIPLSVIFRGADADLPKTYALQLVEGSRVLAETRGDVPKDRKVTLSVPKELTSALRPGPYVLNVTADGLTCVPAPLALGPGFANTSPFRFVQHGDYDNLFPVAGVWDTPEKAEGHVARSHTIGTDLFVDRVGAFGGHGRGHLMYWQGDAEDRLRKLQARLEKDPLSPAPEKARIETPFQRTLSGYSAHGISQMGIVMIMDAGLPIGTDFDKRTPEQFASDITTATRILQPYPAFRGWSWVANWWVGKLGGASAENPAQRKAYDEALKQAQTHGTWNPVLDQVSDIWMNHAVKAQEFFNSVLEKTAPGKVTATAGPYRNLTVYPPITFKNVHEVDLHFQAEQIAPPQSYAHNVDFQKRPGKPAWGHPEVWNDGGTGDYILPTLFQMVMRGADGVGCSGKIPWTAYPEDNRSSASGRPSIHRALYGLLKPYGPWLTALQPSDPVAIVASSRMFRIDQSWGNHASNHFMRLFEANQSCLYAHRPASFVFLEDLKPDTLARYKAILVVDQRVEMEPELARALAAAKAAGVPVFHDDTCRKEIVKDFTPLGIAFNHLEADPSPWQDDSAFWRIPALFLANRQALEKAIGPAVPPAAEIDHPEVLMSERAAGEGRFLFVVNNTSPRELEPGLLWRVTLGMSARVPVQASLRLNAEGKAVYDVFALKKVTPDANGAILTDLRTLPARLYAVLPAEIVEVALSGPKATAAGRPFEWEASVLDPAGKPISTTVPLRVRLLNGQGVVLDERFVGAAAGKSNGVMTTPLNPLSEKLVLEATELFSGKQALLSFAAAPQAAPAFLSGPVPAPAAARAEASVRGKKAGASAPPGEAGFGPHLRSIALSPDGSLAVLNAMNWDNNLYGIETASGKVRWRQRIGNWFAFAPQSHAKGFAVQGYDLNSAEGYHVYFTGADGRPERRFALVGLPKRLPRWHTADVTDRINNFAVPSDGGWVASAGNLGLAVWSRDGRPLWSQDWSKTDRHTLHLLAPDSRTLVTVAGMTVTVFKAQDGSRLWQADLAPTGEIQGSAVSADGKTFALRTSSEGGRVFVVRAGKTVASFLTPARDLTLSPDGAHLAVVIGDQVKVYSLEQGLRWNFAGDDEMHYPRFSAGGDRLVACSELGTVYVFDARGPVLHRKDLGAIGAPAWMPDGDLLLATWMGSVCRLDRTYAERWRVKVQPEAADLRGKLASQDLTPTVRTTRGRNARATPAVLTPNLLKQSRAILNVACEPKAPGDPRPLQNEVELLTDGKPDAPERPWLGWTDINYIDSGWRDGLVINIDAFRTQLRVTAITFVEDPRRPESWLRDVALQHWDPVKEQWIHDQYLVSDAATHTHALDKPVEAARFRLVSTGGGGSWPSGNIRLGELVFHGESLGSSHPDALARKPVAVLFDELEGDLKCLFHPNNGFSYRFEGAFSGGKCLSMEGGKTANPGWQKPFGHAVPGWDFEVVENPQPGQYRWLQFAWKAASPETTGMAVLVGGPWPSGGVSVVAGAYTWREGMLVEKVLAQRPPTEWQVVRVDLWEVLKQPRRLHALSLGATGGGALFDRVLLGRTEADLPPIK